MNKESLKYGFYTLLVWNLFLALLYGSSYLFYNPDLFGDLFENRFSTLFFVGFVCLWSLIWFWIGYSESKKYFAERDFLRSEYPSLDIGVIDKQHRLDYIGKWSKTLSGVTLLAIPIYTVMNLEYSFATYNYVALALLIFFTLLFYTVHRICVGKNER